MDRVFTIEQLRPIKNGKDQSVLQSNKTIANVG